MNTVFLLLAEFETGEIPLDQVAPKYFGLDSRKAAEKARTQSLPDAWPIGPAGFASVLWHYDHGPASGVGDATG